MLAELTLERREHTVFLLVSHRVSSRESSPGRTFPTRQCAISEYSFYAASLVFIRTF